MIKRKHYIFHGQVQGVGFRFTVYQKAKQLQLTGWVRNLYDGDVEAIFQGEEAYIDDLIRYMHNIRYIYIEHMKVEELDVLKSERSFEMKY